VGEGSFYGNSSIAMMADEPFCESAFLLELEGIYKSNVSKVGVY
jgi:hypothetical protein